MKKAYLILLMLGVVVAACNDSASTNDASVNTDTEEETTETTTEAESSMEVDVDALSADINTYRQKIEDQLESLERREMKTTSAAEEIKEKWSAIHFYFDGGQLVRVKTYPYEEQSHRTEEFYYQNGELACAVVEDEGMEQGKEESIQGKVYYFHNGETIREVNNNFDDELSLQESHGDRLMKEAKEYMKMVPNMAS